MSPQRLPPKSERVSTALRDEILRGRFRAGERLPSERDLAERFGVHRGAIREALKKLEQLGIAEIRRGGARVLPLSEASLDVVGPLLDLGDRPDPEFVDQVLEVLCGLFAMAARLGVERADDAQRARTAAILACLEDPKRHADTHAQLEALGDLFLEASGNPVLHLVRRGLQTDGILERLHRLRERLGAARPEPPLDDRQLRRLREAVAARDGGEAASAIEQLTLALRRFARETLGGPPAARPADGIRRIA